VLRPIAELIGGIGEVWPVGEDLRWTGPAPPVDAAVNLHGRGPRSHQLLERFEPRLRIGHAAPGWPGPPWRDGQHERDRWCGMLRAHGIPAAPADFLLPAPGPSPRPGAVVVNPGATYGSRRWPVWRFATVAATLAAAGLDVVITGTPAERTRALAVAQFAGLARGNVLAGQTSIMELAALVAGARLVVTGDTGVAHLTYAFRTPSVVLFGPAPIAQWGPPPAGPHQALTSARERPGDPFADVPDPALLGVRIGEVVTAAHDLLAISR
jgi:ADP-heptose:LPS heptosyltransferase